MANRRVGGGEPLNLKGCPVRKALVIAFYCGSLQTRRGSWRNQEGYKTAGKVALINITLN